jgi:hypothetical protein
LKSKAFQQYLFNYAEVESQKLQFLTTHYDYVVVIPACNEVPNFLESVFSLITDNYLIILVINSPNGNSQWQKINQLVIDDLQEKSIAQQVVSDKIKLFKFNAIQDVLLVDRNAESLQINPKQGVGLARKIGCDIALKLYTQGCIKYPWIFSTDADVILPQNYFSQIKSLQSKYSAVVLDFKHYSQSSRLSNLQYLYDFKMRYYLVGIEYGQVGYAYIPLGSTLIASMESYAQVRGFPKRNAGEDFYLLNKLAKIKPIKYKVDNCIIKIRTRFSDRVLFGTGPAIKKIDDLADINDYSYYNPQCFVYLKLWKQFLDTLWSKNGLLIVEPKDKMLQQLYYFFDCQQVFIKSKKQITSLDRWQQFIHQWFDAFKILKTVHFFDKKFERLNYKRLLKEDSFVKVTSPKLNYFYT